MQITGGRIGAGLVTELALGSLILSAAGSNAGFPL
jgi:hypothetical protein